MRVRQMCFIAEGYPTKDDPIFSFVRQIVLSVADIGIKCSVIAPQSITKSLIRKRGRRPIYWVDRSHYGSEVSIYQPYFYSFSNARFLKYNLTHASWRRVVVSSYRRNRISPDAIYAHFWHCGLVAAEIGEENSVPVFVASGESKITVKELYGRKKLEKLLKKINGVICVSNKNYNESIEQGLSSGDRMIVLPNSVDTEIFKPTDKNDVRRRLGYKEDDFIIVYTGTLSERKGSKRLGEAIKSLRDNSIKCIFLGDGNEIPDCDGILHLGPVPHEMVHVYLQAADVFVLPTLAEGCSNAILEAVACGLPVISSDLAFNYDVLNSKNSILINPRDVSEIAKAILMIKDNKALRAALGSNAIETSKDFDIRTRARKIVNFIESLLGDKI